MTTKVKADIEITGKDKLSKSNKSASKSTKNLKDSVVALSTSYLALKDVLGKMIRAQAYPLKITKDTEFATWKLNAALKTTGKVSQETFKRLNDYAGELEKATGLSGDLILETAAVNKTFGLAENQVKAMTEASAALAKVTGKSLKEANNQLLGTFSGEVGELKKLIPEVNKLTKAQLAQGAAVKLVNNRMKEFITGDAQTFEGFTRRLTIGFENITKAGMQPFLDGLSDSGVYDTAIKSLEDILRVVKESGPQLKEFGKQFGEEVGGAFQFMADMFKILGPEMNMFGESFKRMTQTAKLLLIPLAEVGVSLASIGAFLKGDSKTEKRMEALMERLKASFDANLDDMLGKTEEREKAFVGPRRPTPRPGTTGPDFKPTEFTGPMNVKSQEAQKQEIALREQINAQILAMRSDQENAIVASYNQQIAAVTTMEKKAADENVDIVEDSMRLRKAIAERFGRDIVRLRKQESLQVAQLAGNTSKAIKLQYQQQVEDLKDKRKKDLVTEKEYHEALAALESKRGEALRGTTGSDKMDQRLNTISEMLSSAQSGVNAVIGRVGAMFGPYGTIIAGIFQFFNQTEEQFERMMRTLIRGISEAPKQIVKNMEFFIEYFPEALADNFGSFFDINFWGRAVSSLWKALMRGFSNFWKVLFTGGKLTTELDKAQTKTQRVEFGEDDPDAGENRFKIKDLQLRESRKAGQEFEQTFGDTVFESGKSFNAHMMDAFNNVLAKFKEVGGWISDAWKDAGKLLTAGKDALVNAFKDLAGQISQVFKNAGDYIKKQFDKSVGPMQNAGEYMRDRLLFARDELRSAGEYMRDRLIFAVDKLKGAGRYFRDRLLYARDQLKKITGALGGAVGGGSSGGGVISGTGTPLDRLNNGGIVGPGNLTPRQVRALERSGVPSFNSGGTVPGAGTTDSRLIIATPGEKVINPKKGQSVGGNLVVNMSFNVAAGGKVDEDMVKRVLLPAVKEELRVASRRGELLVSSKGIF